MAPSICWPKSKYLLRLQKNIPFSEEELGEESGGASGWLRARLGLDGVDDVASDVDGDSGTLGC